MFTNLIEYGKMMENQVEIEVELDDTNSLLKDSPKVDSEGLTKWLTEFKQTHYKNRFISRHFWSLCILGLGMGVDVRSILGESILSDLRKVQPKPFEMYLVKPYFDKDTRLKRVSFHL